MRFQPKVFGIASAAVLAASAPSAIAQEKITNKFLCQNVGAFALEPLGDREGHSISIGQMSCRVVAGPMSGGILTGSSTWEWDKNNATLISGGGVARKPGATMVYKDMDGTLALTITEGKVTGFTASGHVSFPVATGGGAALAGKSATWTTTPTGPFEFVIEDKID